MGGGRGSGHDLNPRLEARPETAQAARGALTRWLRSCLSIDFAVVSAPINLALPVDKRERDLVANAVPHRQADFITGRWCAHRALECIGSAQDVLEVNRLGGPVWPPGVIGSISHDAGLCIAIAGTSRGVDGIGVDLFGLSRASALPALAPLILSAMENQLLEREPERPLYVQTLFCIKEAVIKAISPTVQAFIDPRDIDVFLTKDGFEAQANLLPGPTVGWHGQCGDFLVALALNGKKGPYTIDNKPSCTDFAIAC